MPWLLSDVVDIGSLGYKNISPAPSESEVTTVARIVTGPGVRLGWVLLWDPYEKL